MSKKREDYRDRYKAVVRGPWALRKLVKVMEPSRTRDMLANVLASPERLVVGERVSDRYWCIKLADKSRWPSLGADDGVAVANGAINAIASANNRLTSAGLPYHLWFRFRRQDGDTSSGSPFIVGLVDTHKPLTKK